MTRRRSDHGLEFLLAFDGRIHHLEKGYWLQFELALREATRNRPHGLSYSFTLHAPDGTRLVGFDNAHDVPAKGSRLSTEARPPITGIVRRTIQAGPIGSRTPRP
jgi:hypothetical protein